MELQELQQRSKEQRVRDLLQAEALIKTLYEQRDQILDSLVADGVEGMTIDLGPAGKFQVQDKFSREENNKKTLEGKSPHKRFHATAFCRYEVVEIKPPKQRAKHDANPAAIGEDAP